MTRPCPPSSSIMSIDLEGITKSPQGAKGGRLRTALNLFASLSWPGSADVRPSDAPRPWRSFESGCPAHDRFQLQCSQRRGMPQGGTPAASPTFPPPVGSLRSPSRTLRGHRCPPCCLLSCVDDCCTSSDHDVDRVLRSAPQAREAPRGCQSDEGRRPVSRRGCHLTSRNELRRPTLQCPSCR